MARRIRCVQQTPGQPVRPLARILIPPQALRASGRSGGIGVGADEDILDTPDVVGALGRCHSASRCVACGSRDDLVAHHKIPRRYGGLDVLENLEPVCRRCHPRLEQEAIALAKQVWERPDGPRRLAAEERVPVLSARTDRSCSVQVLDCS